MAILLSKEKREALRDLKKAVRELERPEREALKIAQAVARRKREASLERRHGQRQPRVRDKGFLAFIRRQPCEVCGTTKRVEAAHVRAGYPADGWRPTGMQEKPDDRRALPLCAEHHREGPQAQHGGNERRFWAALGVYPPVRCAQLYEAYEAQP